MTYAEKLVRLIKASAQEVIDRAEEFVAGSRNITDFDIWMRFPQNDVPTIECTKSVVSNQVFHVLISDGDKQ